MYSKDEFFVNNHSIKLGKQDIAPVAIFAYNRPDHFKEVLLALAESELHADTKIYIFIDADVSGNVNAEILDIAQSQKDFLSVNVLQRSYSYGLRENIISGINHVLEQHDSVIVLEDDILVSPSFLVYMNLALIYYADNQKIYHINGWTHLNLASVGCLECFLWRGMNCWGWATWKNRWQSFTSSQLNCGKMNLRQAYRFNFEFTENHYSQIIDNKMHRIRTWAVFWYRHIFDNDGLCVTPCCSLTRNIGFDGSGTHCGLNERMVSKTFPQVFESQCYKFTTKDCEDDEMHQLIKKAIRENKQPIVVRMVHHAKKIFNK